MKSPMLYRRLGIEKLESRSMLSIAPIDAGDFYWYQDEQIPLRRNPEVLLVDVLEEADVDEVMSELTAPDGPLAGWEIGQNLGYKRRYLTAPDLELPEGRSPKEFLDDLLQRVEQQDGVDWAAPQFLHPDFRGGNFGRMFITDEIGVALGGSGFLTREAEEMFGGDPYDGYRRLRGTPDQFIVTFAGGGGVEALQEADRLRDQDGVRWASPNFYSYIEFYPPVRRNTISVTIGGVELDPWPSHIPLSTTPTQDAAEEGRHENADQADERVKEPTKSAPVNAAALIPDGMLLVQRTPQTFDSLEQFPVLRIAVTADATEAEVVQEFLAPESSQTEPVRPGSAKVPKVSSESNNATDDARDLALAVLASPLGGAWGLFV